MKTYLVRDVNSPRSRIVEADGFIIEETGYTRFEDEDSNLIARFINVEVEPWSATRESSEEMVELAQKYIDIDSAELMKIGGEQAIKDIRSLAGSVLSQASKD